jgi:hypothetical protein
MIVTLRWVIAITLARARAVGEGSGGVGDTLLTYREQAYAHPAVKIRAHYSLGTLKLDLGDRARGREYLEKFLGNCGKADWDLPEIRDARARRAS